MKHSPKATWCSLNQARACLQYSQVSDDSITMSPGLALAAISRPMRSLPKLSMSWIPAMPAAISKANGAMRRQVGVMAGSCPGRDRRGDDDLDLPFRACEPRLHRGARRCIARRDPVVPHLVHRIEICQVGQEDLRHQDVGVVGAGLGQQTVDRGK